MDEDHPPLVQMEHIIELRQEVNKIERNLDALQHELTKYRGRVDLMYKWMTQELKEEMKGAEL